MSKRKRKSHSESAGADFTYPHCDKMDKLRNPNVAGQDPAPGTTFDNGTGEKLHNVHVELIFWGAYWNDNPLAQNVVDAVKKLLAGPYMSYLAQYDVRRGDVRGVTFDDSSVPDPFSMTDVQGLIKGLIEDERLPEPDEQWPIVYAVMMPAHSTSDDPEALGANSGRARWSDIDLGDVDDDPIYALWVGNDGLATALHDITTVFSHELAEIATDPNGGDGVTQVGCTEECQIGDVDPGHSWCDCVRGVKAQGYWSQLDGNCVLPKMYSLKRTLFGKSIGGKIPKPMASLNAWITGQF